MSENLVNEAIAQNCHPIVTGRNQSGGLPARNTRK